MRCPWRSAFAALLVLLAWPGLATADDRPFTFDWSTDSVDGALAIRFAISVAEPGECYTFASGITGASVLNVGKEQGSPNLLLERAAAGGSPEFVMAIDSLVPVGAHAQGADSRPILLEVLKELSTGEEAGLAFGAGDVQWVDGALTYLYVLQNLDSAAAARAGQPTVHLHVECSTPFALESLEGSHEAFLFSDMSGASEGSGAHVGFQNVFLSAVDDVREFEAEAASVSFRLLTFGTVSEGRADLRHPEGTIIWEFGGVHDDRYVSHDGPGGAYSARVTRVAAGDEGMIGAYAALDPIEAFDELL